MPDKVLYIDDKPELPDQIGEVLAQAGFELIHSMDLAEAEHLVTQERPALVLIEVLFGELDGFDWVERIAQSKANATLPVVVVTRGERTPDLYGRSIELGVKDFLCKPLMRSEILEAVLAFACDGDTESSQPVYSEPEVQRIEGQLSVEPLPELFGRLYRAGASGVLTLQRGREVRSVQLRNGSPVEMGRHRDLEPIADFLLHTGRIDPVQYEMLVDQLMARIAGPREILLGMEALTEAQIMSATYEQARGVFIEMFTWSTGDFSFLAGARLDAGDSMELACDPVKIILAGLKHAPREAIHISMERRLEHYVCLANGAENLLAETKLAPAQLTDATALTGDCTLAEVLASSQLDEKSIYTLLAVGAVEFDEYPVLVLDQESKPDESEDFSPVVEESSSQEGVPEYAEIEQTAPTRRLPRQVKLPRVAAEPEEIEAGLNEVVEMLADQDDFQLFGIDESSRDSEVQAAYRELIDSLGLEQIPRELDALRAQGENVRSRVQQAYERVRGEDTRRAFAGLRKKKGAARKTEVREEKVEEPSNGSRAVEAETWFRTGEGYLASDDFGQAVEAFGMAVHLDPEQGDYAAHLGYAMYRSNPKNSVIRREALEHVAKGVKLAPDREKPLLYLSRIFRETGDTEMGAKILRRALKLNPDNPVLVQEMCMVDPSSTQSKGKGLLSRLRRR